MTTPALLPLKLLIISLVLDCSYAAPRFTKVLLPKAAIEKGAVCLDGSPAGYYVHYGTTMPKKWIIHLQGGAWCYDEDDCVSRTKTIFGSSKDWKDCFDDFSPGVMSDDCKVNPHFCGWSMVYVGYCDGASFAGNVDNPIVWKGTTLYFRGFRNLNAVIDELLNVEVIEEIIFTGCSAGGLATYLHVDYIRSKIPKKIPMHVIVDGGYFIDAPNVNGELYARARYQNIFKMQNCVGGVNQDCVKANRGEEWKCFMAQYTYPYIKTPLFVINSRYDTWQLKNNLQLDCLPPNCTKEGMMQFEKFGKEFLEAAKPAIRSPTNGVFIDSCLVHCQTLDTSTWTQIIVGKQTMGDTFYNWLTKNTAYSKVVDCDYPCNPTCPKNSLHLYNGSIILN